MHYMKAWTDNKKLKQELLKGKFGIEKESLRVDARGYLAATPHLVMEEEQISRDFCESQVEFISGVHLQLHDACDEICELSALVEEKIALRREGMEFLWTYSNPPAYDGIDQIKIAEFTGAYEEKTEYRKYLAKKYGKVKMLYSGVHFNYSLPDSLFDIYKDSFAGEDKQAKKNAWYTTLADALMMDSWLIVALTAASPVAEERFLTDMEVPEEEWNTYASFRNSPYGYWNLFIPELSYADFDGYIESIKKYLATGKISSIKELYYPIRLKPKGENTLRNLEENGINHIELRMLDLNPFCCSGVERKDLIFIHLLIAYRSTQLLSMLEKEDTPVAERIIKRKLHGIFLEQVSEKERIQLHQKASRVSFWEENPDCKTYASDLLAEMKQYYKEYTADQGYVPAGYDIFEVLDFEMQKIQRPECRYAFQIKEKYQQNRSAATFWVKNNPEEENN